MPLPHLPPAGNMTHLHGYKVRVELSWWVVTRGRRAVLNFIWGSYNPDFWLRDLQIANVNMWVLLLKRSRMLLQVKIADASSNKSRPLRSSNNQEDNHMPLWQFRPPGGRQRGLKRESLSWQCCWVWAFSLSGSNRCRIENWCFRNGASGVDFTSSHTASPVAPPFGLRGHIQSWAKIVRVQLCLLLLLLFSFKTILYQIHATFPLSSACVASEREVHDIPPESLELQYLKYICWNRTVIIRD